MEQPSSSGSVASEIPEDLFSLVWDDQFYKNNMEHFLHNTKFSDVWDTEMDCDLEEP